MHGRDTKGQRRHLWEDGSVSALTKSAFPHLFGASNNFLLKTQTNMYTQKCQLAHLLGLYSNPCFLYMANAFNKVSVLNTALGVAEGGARRWHQVGLPAGCV